MTWTPTVATTALDGGGVTLGSVLTIWDRLAGTWSPAPVAATAEYGVAESADRDGVIRVQLGRMA